MSLLVNMKYAKRSSYPRIFQQLFLVLHKRMPFVNSIEMNLIVSGMLAHSYFYKSTSYSFKTKAHQLKIGFLKNEGHLAPGN